MHVMLLITVERVTAGSAHLDAHVGASGHREGHSDDQFGKCGMGSSSQWREPLI